MRIDIVPQENCPRCGGGEEFMNRPKIGHEDGTWSWRCYNPACTLGYWNPDTGETEDKPSPEEQAAIEARARAFAESLTFGEARYFVGGVEVDQATWRKASGLS
jgi:hypothetical protein